MFQRILRICATILLILNLSACKFPADMFKKMVRESESPPEQIISRGTSDGELCLDCPVEADWSKANTDRLAVILQEYGFQVGREQIDERMVEHAWQTRIFPDLRDEWELDADARGREYWNDVGNACHLHALSQMEAGELAAHILVGKLDTMSSGSWSRALFVSEFLKPHLVLEDVLCLMFRKVLDKSIDKSLEALGAPRSISHCINLAAKLSQESSQYTIQLKEGCR